VLEIGEKEEDVGIVGGKGPGEILIAMLEERYS